MKKNRTETVILTVGTIEQKKLCEKLTAGFEKAFDTEFIIVSDEDFGGRIGSGGALTGVIENFYEPGRKMLVINSGGFSKRSVNYSVRGKLFANFLIDGKEKTLLELLVSNGRNLFPLMENGIVVCCSDILVCTEKFKNKLKNNAGFCIRADFETASRHGVMYRDKSGILDIYPHKTSYENLVFLSEKYEEKGALIDTGMIYFSDEVCIEIKNLAEQEKIIKLLAEDNTDLNLYPDIVALFAKKVNREEFLSSSENETHKKIKEILFSLSEKFSLDVIALEGQEFIHIGSVREALKNIISLSGEKDKFISVNSIVDNKSKVEKNTVLDNVILEDCTVGENCLISDVTLEKINVDRDTSVCGIKQKDGSFVTVVCPVHENPKEKTGEKELWDLPRFYKGKSFTESFVKFMNSADEEKFSMAHCTENADADYYVVRQRYLRDKIAYFPNEEYIKNREEILRNFFSKTEDKKELKCAIEKSELFLPVRVNLSGTWTDAMPYCVYNGGEVINMAVTVDGEKPIKVTASKAEENCIEFCSDGVTEFFSFEEKSHGEDLSDFNLHRAVLKVLGITEKTKLVDGIKLETEVSSIDKGSGLGTSSILLAGCFKALGKVLGTEFSDEEIFEKVFVAEQIMKTGGGWQDQAGGLVPGLKITSSEAGTEQKLTVKKISLSEKFEKFISEKFILIPTGQRHFGRFIVSNVAARYFERNEEALSAYSEMKVLNSRFLKSIEEENFSEFTNLINRHFEILRKISPAVSDERIDALSASLLENCVDAVSVCGAGGGGYLLSVMKDNVSVSDVQNFIKNNFGYITGKVKKIDIFY